MSIKTSPIPKGHHQDNRGFEPSREVDFVEDVGDDLPTAKSRTATRRAKAAAALALLVPSSLLPACNSTQVNRKPALVVINHVDSFDQSKKEFETALKAYVSQLSGTYVLLALQASPKSPDRLVKSLERANKFLTKNLGLELNPNHCLPNASDRNYVANVRTTVEDLINGKETQEEKSLKEKLKGHLPKEYRTLLRQFILINLSEQIALQAINRKFASPEQSKALEELNKKLNEFIKNKILPGAKAVVDVSDLNTTVKLNGNFSTKQLAESFAQALDKAREFFAELNSRFKAVQDDNNKERTKAKIDPHYRAQIFDLGNPNNAEDPKTQARSYLKEILRQLRVRAGEPTVKEAPAYIGEILSGGEIVKLDFFNRTLSALQNAFSGFFKKVEPEVEEPKVEAPRPSPAPARDDTPPPKRPDEEPKAEAPRPSPAPAEPPGEITPPSAEPPGDDTPPPKRPDDEPKAETSPINSGTETKSAAVKASEKEKTAEEIKMELKNLGLGVYDTGSDDKRKKLLEKILTAGAIFKLEIDGKVYDLTLYPGRNLKNGTPYNGDQECGSSYAALKLNSGETILILYEKVNGVRQIQGDE